LYFSTGIAVYLFSVVTAPSSLAIKMTLNTLYIFAFVVFVLKKENTDFRKLKSLFKRT